jgi:hypothetical protein
MPSLTAVFLNEMASTVAAKTIHVCNSANKIAFFTSSDKLSGPLSAIVAMGLVALLWWRKHMKYGR